MTLQTSSPAYVARAAVEGLLCGLADGMDAMVEQGVAIQRVILVGGGARSSAGYASLGNVAERPPPFTGAGTRVALCSC